MVRKLLLNILLLVIVFFCFAFALSNILIKGRPMWAYLNRSIMLRGGQSHQMTCELDTIHLPNDGYFIFGSSHAYRAYDPAYFKKAGIEVFNAGSSSQSINCSFTLMKYYHQKIHRVILDIYPGSFCKATGESQLILMQGSPDFRLAAQLLLIKINVFTINNILYRALRLDDAGLYREGGYQGRGYEMSTLEMNEPFIPDPKREYDEEEYMHLIEIIHYCRKEHIDLTLVSHPLPIPDEKITDYWKFKVRMREICEQYAIPFFDYTYRYNLDNSHFMDMNHLNKKGVDFFDKKFLHDKFDKIPIWN